MKPPQDVNDQGGSHTTPLPAASVEGHLDVASLLVKSGADPNSRDDLGRVPPYRVSQGGQLVITEASFEIARLFVNYGSNVNVADDEGWTPLQHIVGVVRSRNCWYRGIGVARLLIDRGADMNALEENRWTAQHFASCIGHLDITKLLIDHDTSVYGPNNRQVTPFPWAWHHFLGTSKYTLD